MIRLPYNDRRDAVRMGERTRLYVCHLSEYFPKLVKDFNAHRLLDIGTGFGDFVVEACKQGFDVYGIDCREEIYEGPKDRFLPGNLMERWPFEGGEFDLVFDRYTIEDLIDLQGLPHNEVIGHIAREAQRVLRVVGYYYTNYRKSLPGFRFISGVQPCFLYQKE